MIPLVNIVITDNCPGNCPYCFNPASSVDESSLIQKRNMSVDGFSSVLKFLKQSGATDVRLLGGEPLLHPQLSEFIALINRSEEFETVTVFTGGLFPRQVLDLLDSAKVRFVFNLNHPNVYARGQHGKAMANLEAISDEGYPLTIGYNIYEAEFDYRFVLDSAKSLDIQTVRLCIAKPSIKKTTQVLEANSRHMIGSRFLAMAEECAKSKLEIIVDCVLPMCYFSDEQWGRLSKLYPQVTSRCGVCSPALDIDPLLKVHRCFALSGVAMADLSDFHTSKELFEHFGERIDRFKWLAAEQSCGHCATLAARKCQGDCIALHYVELRRLESLEAQSRIILSAAYDNLRGGDISSAICLFQRGLKVYPHDIKATCDYIFTLIRAGYLDEAVGYLAKGAEIRGTELSGAFQMVSGLIAECERETTKAISHYRRALRSVNHDHRNFLRDRLTALKGNVKR